MSYKGWETFVFKASGALAASAAGDAIFIPPEFKGLTARIHVTAQSGTTPTLNVKFQGSFDGTNFFDLNYPHGTTAAAFAEYAAATGKKSITFESYVPWMRIYSTIGGTSPSFTFKVEATTKEQYE